MAKLDNGQWAETTLEEKFGHLAPLNPDKPYFTPSPNYAAGSYGDNFHQRDRNYILQILNPIWTGDLVTRQVTDQDTQITEVDGIFVMRDTKGELVKLTIRLHSPDIPGDFCIFITKMIDSIHYQTLQEVGVPSNLLPLGKQVWLTVYYQVPESAIQPSWCNQNGYCSDGYNAEIRQLWAQKTQTQEFIKALNTGQELPEKPNLVLISNFIEIDE